jgi:hypothetical protein
LRELAALTKEGDVDQLIERAVRWAESDSRGETVQALSQLAERLVAAEAKQHGKVRRLLCTSIAKEMPKQFGNPRRIMLSSRGPFDCKHEKASNFFLVRGAGGTFQGKGRGGLVASTGPVRLTGSVRREFTAVFACETVTLEQSASDLLIVCGGDVQIRGKSLTGCLIVARGNVTLPAEIGLTAVFAGGKVEYASPQPRLHNCVIRPNDNTGLGVVKFFDPARAGIDMVESKEGLKVKKVHKDKPFASALHAGDVVTAVGDARVCSADAFRRALRAALAEGARSITLTAWREGKPRDVRVRVRR